MSKLTGGQLAGGNPANGRVEYDYYATNPEAVTMLLNKTNFFDNCETILEPCVGEGHIVKSFNNFYNGLKNITAIDIVDRGFDNTIVTDFLNWETDKKFDGIITNPPYSLAKEFAEKGFSLLKDNGVMAMFLKIQFLEGAKRELFFKNYPPKYIYVFRNRMATWNNGQPVDPNTGKKWATTMCHAWFIWIKSCIETEPIIRWL